MLKFLKSVKWGYLLIAFFAALFGVLLVMFHNMLHYVALTVGVCTVLFAIVLAIVKAVIALIAGVVTIVGYRDAGTTVADVLCLVMLVDGSLKLGTTVESIRNRFFGRWVMLVLALTVIVASFLLTKNQPEKLGLYLGLVMLVDAVANLLTTVFAARNEKRIRESIRKELTAGDQE